MKTKKAIRLILAGVDETCTPGIDHLLRVPVGTKITEEIDNAWVEVAQLRNVIAQIRDIISV